MSRDITSSAGGAKGRLPDSWRVCLPVFEGPLDLLLHLTRINEVDLSDIPVATICDQFHEYLALMEELDLDVAGEYVYEASVLIQLKSRMLLPVERDEAGQPVADPRQELVQRLIEYRKLKEAAQTLAEVHSVRRGIWTREKSGLELLPAEGDPAELDLGDLSLFDLLGALRSALERYDREHPAPLTMGAEDFSVRDQIGRLVAQLEGGKPYDLSADLRRLSCRAEAIAAFLAVLEMARLALVRLHQTAAGPILLYRTAREVRADELEAIRG